MVEKARERTRLSNQSALMYKIMLEQHVGNRDPETAYDK